MYGLYKENKKCEWYKNNFLKTSPYFSPQQIIEFFFLLLKNEINHYLELRGREEYISNETLLFILMLHSHSD